ncbi:N4 gp24-like protein [Pseudomonas phage LUZ7]|uniref:N4 gp24-like protein n=1 Tax=Pseudomonas phage LUZ7 TaxID=655097 RepID=C8ZKD1_9CAUD|nr:ATPase [Pseudomonas phage LUZ7]CAZ66178.1 N4 gp24-like protein [Pseudomonas phage LUZ7]
MHFDETQKVSIFKAGNILRRYLKCGLVPMLHGSPAIGKSALVKSLAKEFNLLVIDERLSQCDPTDLKGLPDLAGDRATFKTFDHLPLEGDKIPAGYNGWLLFLDEINSADDTRQAAAYKLVLDRMVGHKNLHPSVAIVAAGNLETDGAIVNPLSSALISRFVHLYVEHDLKSWLNNVALPNGYSSVITSYLEFQPNAFYTFDPANEGQIYAAPRTWEFANALITDMVAGSNGQVHTILNSMENRIALAGAIGMGNVVTFKAFVDYYESVPKAEDLINNPETVPVPEDNPGLLCAICGAIGEIMDAENAEQLLKYINRLPADYRVVALKGAVKRRGAGLISVPAISNWMMANADKLL